ncbi:transporter, auxin efflux carrier (AEC) family protein [[Bacteroides] pectinophilus ATCC 43243]|uniref:Auxin efflux carrier n=1 Tax=[Bacteroides] pectinophilus ATCC 43243 TaxID=483218 RepID=B7AWH8_9FIRM|nr:transporter, auxin efflux carrier (AEC) family protein [[Bacteroides] pectinophilus ATCC 43243]
MPEGADRIDSEVWLMVALQQMLVLFIIMMIGFIAYKKNIITDETSKKLSAIVVNISNPALILSSVTGNATVTGAELVETMFVAIGMYVFLIAVAALVPVIIKAPARDRGTYRVMTIFGNVGFMGFPIISSLYGGGALLYASLFLLPYNILIYTYGVWEMCKSSGEGSGAVKKSGRESIKQIFNIGVIFCIIAVVVYALGIKFPAWVNTTVSMLSSTTAPLSMMVIGASFATMNFKKVFLNVRTWVFSALRLLVIPVLGTFLVSLVTDNPSIIGVTMVMLGVPVGSMTAMLAQEYGGDYALSSETVAMTTLLSVVTFPIVSMVMHI